MLSELHNLLVISPFYTKKIKSLRKFLFLIFAVPATLFSQLKIDQGGDGWKEQTEKALDLIAKTDSSKFSMIQKNCDHISFWLGGFSSNHITPEGERIILVSVGDMELASTENLCGVLIHESVHLWIINNNVHVDPFSEELLCYNVELDFMKKLGSVDPWILQHIENQITYYKNKKLQK